MAREDNLFLAQAPQVSHQGRELLHVLGQAGEPVASKGAGQAGLEDRVAEPRGIAELLRHGSYVLDRMRSVAQAADEDQGIASRRRMRAQLIRVPGAVLPSGIGMDSDGKRPISHDNLVRPGCMYCGLSFTLYAEKMRRYI